MSTKNRINTLLTGKLGLIPANESFENEENIFNAGLDSLKMIRLIELLEDEFSIEIPEEQISPNDFSSIATIESLIEGLQVSQ